MALLVRLFSLFFFITKPSFSKNSSRNTNRMSNRLDPDRDRRYVGPDLGSNCLQNYQQRTLVDKELTH